uniref:Uncharacterized protein n=1 Tax=Arundo donax TaxID=35708 RepID=A0A0A9B3C2_ARUDO
MELFNRLFAEAHSEYNALKVLQFKYLLKLK